MRVVRKIDKPRPCRFDKNCPSPGRRKEKNGLRAELRGKLGFFSIVAMENCRERKTKFHQKMIRSYVTDSNDGNTFSFLSIDRFELGIVNLLGKTLKHQFAILQ